MSAVLDCRDKEGLFRTPISEVTGSISSDTDPVSLSSFSRFALLRDGPNSDTDYDLVVACPGARPQERILASVLWSAGDRAGLGRLWRALDGFRGNGIGVLEERTARNRVRVFLWGEAIVFFCTPLDCFSIRYQRGAANGNEVENEKGRVLFASFSIKAVVASWHFLHLSVITRTKPRCWRWLRHGFRGHNRHRRLLCLGAQLQNSGQGLWSFTKCGSRRCPLDTQLRNSRQEPRSLHASLESGK